MEGLKRFKVSGPCIRAPFCIRQMLRDLKKTDKEKVEKSKMYVLFNIFQRDLLENLKQKADDKEQRNEVEDWKNKYENLDNELQLLKTRFVFVFVGL